MSTRTKILGAVAVLAVLVIVLSRGGEDSGAQLQALEADPMAAYVPPGGTLVDTESQNEGTSLGKPVPAQYTRMFELTAAAGRGSARACPCGGRGGGVDADRRSPASAALSPRSGRRRAASSSPSSSSGTRSCYPTDVKPPALQISLRHLG